MEEQTDSADMESFNDTGWVISPAAIPVMTISEPEHEVLLEEGLTKYKFIWKILAHR